MRKAEKERLKKAGREGKAPAAASQSGYLSYLSGSQAKKKNQEEEEGCEVVEVRRGPEQVRVTQGLTTAAAVWMSAALGVTAATGVSRVAG